MGPIIRITDPPPGQIFSSEALRKNPLIDVEVAIETDKLGDGRSWELEGFVLDERRNKLGEFQKEIRRAYDEHVQVTAGTDGSWRFSPSVQHHRGQIKLPEMSSGRYDVRAVAVDVEGGKHEHVISFVVDDDPPNGEFVVGNDVIKEDDLVELEIGQALRVSLDATDGESGLRSVRFWLDEKDNGKLDKTESKSPPLDFERGETVFSRTVKLNLPAKNIKNLPPGKYALIAELTDQAGLVSQMSRTLLLSEKPPEPKPMKAEKEKPATASKKDPPKKKVEKPKSDGTLKLVFNKYPAKLTVSGSGKKNFSEVVKQTKEFTKRLPPGPYTLTIKYYSKVISEQVTIQSGKTVTKEIGL